MPGKKKINKDAPAAETPWDPSDTCEVSVPCLLEAVKAEGVYAYDLETTSLNPRTGKIKGVAFYVPNEKDPTRSPIRAWFPFEDGTMEYTSGGKSRALRPHLDLRATMEQLRDVWSLPNVIAIRHNGIFDDAFLYNQSGLDEPLVVKNIIADSMLADYVSDERRKQYGLKLRVSQVFGHRMTTFDEVAGGQMQFGFANRKPMGVYAADDCVWAYRLWRWAMNEIRSQDPPTQHDDSWCSPLDTTPGLYSNLEKIYWKIEMRIQQILMEMEITGCFIDWEWLVNVQTKLNAEKEAILAEFKDQVGWVPNLASPKQVSDFLYKPPERGGLGLPTEGVDYNATTDQYATGDKAIKHRAPQYPLVQKLLDYRSLSVIDSSFCQKLISLAQQETRIHARFRQTGTVIGRLSSADPINLMNQPKEKDLIRRAFCAHLENDLDPVRREMCLVDADYSQMELRMAAHLAKEARMIEVFLITGHCPAIDGRACPDYLVWACKNEIVGADGSKKGCKFKWAPEGWYPGEVADPLTCPKCGGPKIEHLKRCRHVDLHQKSAEDIGVSRDLAKSCNFGLLYRMGAPKFCVYSSLFDEHGNIRLQYGQELIAKWHAAYPGIATWHERVIKKLVDNDYIAYNLFRRRRRLDIEWKRNDFRAGTQAIQFEVSGCVVPSTTVLTERGYVEIRDLFKNKLPIFDGAEFTDNYNVYETGEKEVFKVSLADGHSLICSADHRFATMNGLQMEWTKTSELAASLQNGEPTLVATHDILAPGGESDHGASVNDAYLIGALIGDGYYGSSQGFTLAASAKEPGWPESLESSVVASQGEAAKARIRWGTRKTNRGGLVKDLVVNSSQIRNNLMVLGLDCVSKQQKRIPEWVFTASPEIRGAVLAGLVDTDGSVLSYKQKTYTSLTIQYSSRVKELVDGAWRIASSLGIDCGVRELDTVSTSKSGGRVKQYRMDVSYRGFQAFNRWVPLRHPRKAAVLEGALQLIAKRAPRRELPTSFVKSVAQLASESPVLSSRQGASSAFEDRRERRRVQTYIGHAEQGKAGENMIEAILDYIEEPGPKEVLGYGWSRVASVESMGILPTYDIELLGDNHAYIADGILTHNSCQDIIKLAMIRIFDERNRRIANSRPAESKLWSRVKFLIQVHDELMFECPKAIADEHAALIKSSMEGAANGLRVPFTADARYGRNWDDAK